MDRRRAAGLLLALAACIATATAAPTATNHTALDLYDGAPDGCYYNFQHYGEGDRIMTNEPCLNCTCHNRMLMCYLRVCPFTKAIGQDCTVEKRADQCCPIVTCPDVPVDLLTSTTTSPAEYGPTGVGKLDKFGCSINGKYFSEGSKVPPTPNKPCEHCYCIRNMTTCVMQECTLHVDGCTPIYHKDVCCPVRYSCDHPEDEMPLLDDLSTTVRPTPGFLLTTTTISPVTQMSQDCIYDNRVFSDGASIKTEKACDHCYCMKGDIVCVVQECGTPMENEGKNCTALPPREGVCCPDTYICEGDESITETYETYDFTTHSPQEDVTTLLPPRRTSSEGSGYRNEPDEIPYTESPSLEPEIEGSGIEEEPQQPTMFKPSSTGVPGLTDDILASTEETHEYIPLTTTKPIESDITTMEVGEEDESMISSSDEQKSSESQQNLPSTTSAYSEREDEEPKTEKTQEQDIGSGEMPGEDENLKPHEEILVTSGLPVTEKSATTTEINKLDIITPGIIEQDFTESETLTTSVPNAEEKTKEPIEQVTVTGDTGEKTTSHFATEQVTITPTLEESSETAQTTESSLISEETAANGAELEIHDIVTTNAPTIENDVKQTTDSAEQDKISSVTNEFNREDNIEPQNYKTSTSAPGIDDEFVTTEYQEHEPATENVKETDFLVPHQPVTASTPMLEEIEKDTTEYTKPERIVPSDATQDDTSYITSSTIAYIDNDEKDVTESSIPEENITEDHILDDQQEITTMEPYKISVIQTSHIPAYEKQEITTVEPHIISDIQTSYPTEADVKESSEPEQYSPPTSTPASDKNGRRTTPSDLAITISEDDSTDFVSTTTISVLEMEGATTEPDKGLNTIPSDSIEDGSVSLGQKTTVADEKITTESDLYTKFNFDVDSITIPSKQTTISSDTSVSREEPSTLTTESAFRKDDYSPTEIQASPELTIVAAGVTKEVISTLTHDHTMSTESILDVQQDSHTTSEPKYTETIEESTSVKESTGGPSYESSTPETSEKEISAEEEITTNVPLHEKLPETTANQVDNEISNEPRIPGEGDCLLNGVTYTNESIVPSNNKCQSGCKCISSIIKCDPIICSPPPEYMDHCETMYDTPEACCPTYICDHRTETIPPQSHSQMSGTEAPVTSHVHCHGDECEISEDKKQPEEPLGACKSGSCVGSSDESQYTTSYPSAENIPEQPKKDQKEECIGDKCTPILCTDENGCSVSPVTPCEGENCVKIPEIISVQEPCADGEDCTIVEEPSKECSAGNCGTNTQLEDTYPKETCTDKEGCQNIPNISEKECTEENCKKQEISPLDQNLPEQCTEPDCKQTEKDIEASTPSVLEVSPQDKLDEDIETSVTVTETTEKLESPTVSSQYIPSHETSELPEVHEMVTEQQPTVVPDQSLTTLSFKTEVATKSESDLETTNKPTDFTYEQEVTSSDKIPDKTKLDSTEEPGYLIPVSTETKIKDNETNIPSLDETGTEIPDASITSEDAIYTEEHITTTEHPQKIEATVTTELAPTKETTTKLFDGSSTEPSKTYTSKTQEITESSETLKPEDVTLSISEETSTESSKTSDSHEVTKPLDEIEHDDTTKGVKEESSTEPHKTDDTISEEGLKIPEIQHDALTTSISIQESSTEPSIIYSTESQTITESPVEIRPEDITKESTEENITEPPKSSDDTKYDDFTNEMSEERGTEPTRPFKTEEQTGDIDHVETPSKPSDESTTETLVLLEDSQKVTKITGDIDQVSTTTMKTAEEISSELPTSFSIDSQDATESPKEKEHEDTPSIITEETETEPTKTYVTESLDITKSSEQLDNEVTSIEVLVEPSTESSISHSTEEQSTKSPQDSHDDDVPTKISDESSTLAPKIYTESEVVTKSSDVIEHEDITISSEGTSTEPSQTYVTKIKSPGEDYHDATTSKIIEESSTEIPKMTINEQEITKSPDKIDDQDTTTVISEETYPITTKPEEVPESPEEVNQKDTTSKISEEPGTEPPKIHSTEQQEVTKSPEDIGSETTTVNILEVSSTGLPVIETEPQGISVLPEIVDQEDTTSKAPKTPVTETSITYITEDQYLSTTSENVELINTTIKASDESATEHSKIPDENVLPPKSPLQPVVESDEMGTLIPTITETLTEEPKKDEEKLSTGSEIAEIMTTAQEIFTPELVESTTLSFIPDSQKTAPEVAKPEETTSEAISDSKSQTTQSDLDDITESVKEQVSSTPVPTDHYIAITAIPITSDSEETHIQTTLETQTTLSPTDKLEEVSKPDVNEILSTQKPDHFTVVDKDVTVQSATEEVPAITISDELRTTSPEIQELTTLKPVEATQAPHDVEIKTDYPEISDKPQEEQQTENLQFVSQEVTTEEILASSKQPAEVEEKNQTEKPITVTATDLIKGTESEKETSETSSKDKPLSQEESYTEELASKYSSPTPTTEYDSSKFSAEDVSTIEPMMHEPVKPEKPIDGASLVTEQYEISTKSSDLDTDSQTQIPVHLSSAIPESDITQTSEQDIVKEKLTTPSVTTISEFDNKSELVTSTDYTSSVQEEIHTESPSSEDKIGDEKTTQKEHLSEETITSVQPSVPEQTETSTIPEHKFATERPDMLPAIEVTTKTIPSDTLYTEIQESVTTDKSLVEMLTESSYTTEASETKVTSVEDQQSPVSDHDHTESEQEITKTPEVQTQEQTELPETVPAFGTEAPTLEPVDTTEFSSSVEQTTTPRRDYSESTSSHSIEYTDKIMDENAISSSGEQFTTESARVTESSSASISTEVYTEKLPETIQTVTPEKAIPIEEFLTTRKQYEPGVYQTTYSTIDDIPEISTHSPVSEEEAIEHTSPKEEQTMPVDISDIEKISTTEESVQVQTEKATQASEKPVQGITAPEEEFILATSKVTTKAEEELSISTLSPIVDSSTRPGDAESLVTTAPEAPATITSETPVTTEAEASVTRTPEVPVMTVPEEPVRPASDTPITTEAEISVTETPNAPITTSSETLVTTEPKAPSSTSELLITTAPESPVTAVPEASITKLPEVADPITSDESVTTAPKAPVTLAHQTPITELPVAPITTAPEAPVTIASEAPSTTASEAPATTAPEVPISSAPELPKPVSTEMQPTDEVSTHDGEPSFPPSSETSGYGQEPDYGDDDQTFGPGTCRYGGKVYVSAQQIPRDDPCDFCFCFRSDIICLQQSCPPPIHGCHEEPIQGFCCPRYECPVSMATTVNVTTTTTTTTTTLPPHFPTHSYKGSVQKRGCQIKGQTYKVGEVVRASSGPCLHCTCGGDGQMKCDPKACTPEPMLRQMIAAAVSAKRRR